MGFWPFRRSRAENDAETLLDLVMSAARRPAFYGEGRVPDTLDGRFEAMALYGSLALIRLRATAETADLAQVFTDKLFRHFDAGLREAGVGDLTVPKKMRGLAASFYGRLEAYSLALNDGSDLADALQRNIGVSAAFAGQLAAEIRKLAQAQAARPWDSLLTPGGWAS